MSPHHRRASFRSRVWASRDDGAGSVEYLGATMVVALVIVSLLMAATPLGNQIAAKLCAAVGATCGDPTGATGPKGPPEGPCTLQTDDIHVEAGGSVLFINLGGEGEVSVSEESDGTYKVVVSGEAGAEAALSAGEAYGKLQIGDYGGSVGLSASVSAGTFQGAGVEYSFDSEKKATEFTDFLTREVAKHGSAGAANAVLPGAGIGVEALGWLWDKVTGYSYKPPAPNSSYFEGGITVKADAEASALTAGGQASADYANAVGFKLDHVTGERTIYNKVTLDAQASAQLGLSTTDANFGSGASGSAGVEMVVSTVVDKNFQVVGVSFDAAATAEGAGNLTALLGTELQGGGGKGVKVSATLDVNDANRRAILAALGGLGVGVGTGDASAVATAVPQLLDAARAAGDVTAQFIDVNSSNLVDAAIGLKIPGFGGVGLNAGASTASETSTGAYYLNENGWQQWAACA